MVSKVFNPLKFYCILFHRVGFTIIMVTGGEIIIVSLGEVAQPKHTAHSFMNNNFYGGPHGADSNKLEI